MQINLMGNAYVHNANIQIGEQYANNGYINGSMSMSCNIGEIYKPTNLQHLCVTENGSLHYYQDSYSVQMDAALNTNPFTKRLLVADEQNHIRSINIENDVLDVFDKELRLLHPQLEESWKQVQHALAEYLLVKKLVS